MEDFTLEVNRRSETGAGANRRLRLQGMLPSVVYHRGEEPVPSSVSTKLFVQLAQKVKASQVFRLKSDDSNLNGKSVIVREVQRDYIKGKVLHVDFQALRDDEEITLRIPIQITGEAPGVKTDGGILSIMTHEVGISCLPKDIPNSIEMSISQLQMGGSIHAGDLILPEGVSLADDADETIVSVVAIRQSKDDAAAAETAAAASATASAASAAAVAAAATPAKK